MAQLAGGSEDVSGQVHLATVIARIVRASRYRSQRALAKALKVSQGTVSNYLRPESGRKPGVEMIRRIAALCAESPEQRVQYEQAMLQARARYDFPELVLPSDGKPALPPLEMPVVFRERVQSDLAKFPRRQWRPRLAQAGLTWRVVHRMLIGTAVLTVDQVRALAHAIGANEDIYLALVNAPTERFHQWISGQHDLLAHLLRMPASSRKDLESALRSSARGEDLGPQLTPRATTAHPRKRPATARRVAPGGRTR